MREEWLRPEGERRLNTERETGTTQHRKREEWLDTARKMIRSALEVSDGCGRSGSALEEREAAQHDKEEKELSTPKERLSTRGQAGSAFPGGGMTQPERKRSGLALTGRGTASQWKGEDGLSAKTPLSRIQKPFGKQIHV